MIVISDTSPISNLIDLEHLGLLKSLFGKVIIPFAVDLELLQVQDEQFFLTYQAALNDGWIEVKKVTNTQNVQHLTGALDHGEAEAIVLAIELNADRLLIDERAGYQIAKQTNLKPIGLLGVLIVAKNNGLIQSVRPLLDQLRNQIGFWVSDSVYHRVLQIVGE
ncbi:MAG: DUF3368 domain-containing protein [Bacteroidia bacterium]